MFWRMTRKLYNKKGIRQKGEGVFCIETLVFDLLDLGLRNYSLR
jgi:hypothetical protein